MKALSSIILFWFIGAISLSAQNWTLNGNQDSVKINLNIGKASDNSFTKSKGAEISGVFPGNDTVKNSWLTNSYIELGIKSDISGWSFGFVGEIHKNTLVEKEQDVRQYGVSFGKIITNHNPSSNVAISEIPILLSFKNSKDLKKEKETFQVIVGVTYNRFTGANFLKTQTQFPKVKSTFGKIIGFSHNHNIGCAYLGMDENVLLGQFDFEFNTFLFPGLSNKWINKPDFFKLQFTYQGRTPILGQTELDLNSNISLNAGINISFDKKNSIELSYNWIQGADPLKGLENQNYETITARVKIALK